MAIATGTAVLIGAGVAAGGGIAKAKIDSNAAKRAGQIQQQSGSDALDYQKGRDTISDQRYMDMWKDYQTRHAAWEQRNFGSKGAGGGASGYENLIATPAAGIPDVSGGPAEGSTVADLGPWSDWRRYGVS